MFRMTDCPDMIRPKLFTMDVKQEIKLNNDSTVHLFCNAMSQMIAVSAEYF